MFVEAEPYLDFDDWRGRWLSGENGRPVAFQEIQPEAHQMIPRLLFAAEIDATAARRFHVRDAPAPPVAIGGGPVVSARNAVQRPVDRAARQRRHRGHSPRRNRPPGPGGSVSICAATPPIHGRSTPIAGRSPSRRRWWRSGTSRRPVRFASARAARWPYPQTPGSSGRSVSTAASPACTSIWRSISTNASALQMPIDLVGPSRWTDGIAGAHVDRQASPSEWPRLVAAPHELDIGLVTNDVYSHSVDGQAWQPTCCEVPRWRGGGRPATYAGRDQHTDQGVHRFAIALVLGGDLATDDLTEAAQQQAQPLIVFDRYGNGPAGLGTCRAASGCGDAPQCR